MDNMKQTTRKLPPLWLCILLDTIGMLSYLFPNLGEAADIAWAPISAFLFIYLFGDKKGAIFTLLEEAIPYTDIIPTFTIAYFVYKKKLTS